MMVQKTAGKPLLYTIPDDAMQQWCSSGHCAMTRSTILDGQALLTKHCCKTKSAAHWHHEKLGAEQNEAD
jgi:hypothetical protein